MDKVDVMSRSVMARDGRDLLEAPTVSLETMVAAGLMRPDGKRTRLSEERKLVSLSLRYKLTQHADRPAIVMVSSAHPGEGKSYVSLNLAAGLAMYSRRKVVFVDLDSKVASMTSLLGLSERMGVVDLAADPDLDVSGLLVSTAIAALSILPVGVGDGEVGADSKLPAEAVEDAYNRLEDRIFVVDCPPCLSLAEPKAMAFLAGFLVFVVQAEVTQANEVEGAISHVAHSGLDVNLLLNRVHLARRDSFGSYAYYG